MQPLSVVERSSLESAPGAGFRVVSLESWKQKLRMARFLWRNAELRISLREAFEVHRKVIQWGARYSEELIPSESLGTDPLTTRMTQWAMKSWERQKLMVTYLGASLLPRLEMDVLPAIRCGAHFVIVADNLPRRIDDYVAAGRAVQRFWLTATKLSLKLQPQMTPIIFSGYSWSGVKFSSEERPREKAERLAKMFEDLLGQANARRAVFMGRLGHGRDPRSRSLRRPLQRLLILKAPHEK